MKSALNNRPKHDGRVHGVVVACFRPSDQKWLMIRRGKNVAAPLAICFPGGAREVGEKVEVAAMREMKEELSADVTLLEEVWYHECDDRPLTLFGFLGRLENDDISHDPKEVEEALWLTTEEALTHPEAIPNSRFFLEKLVEALPRHF